jgi:putative inorganic carbon (HCO3(-)) transporter
MIRNDITKYFLPPLLLLSATFCYGAYGLGTVFFIVLFCRDRKEIIDIAKADKSILLMGSVLLLSTLTSKAPYESLLVDGVLLLHFMIYIVMIKLMDGNRAEEIFQRMNLLGIGICLYGAYQYFTGDLTVISSWTDRNTFGNIIRIYSTMRNPNIFAAYLTFNICFAGAHFIKKRADIYIAINIMLSSICLVLTYSRGGFFSFVAAMLVLLLLCKDSKIIIYTLFMLLFYYGYNRMENINRADLSKLLTDSSSLYRLEIWKASFELFKQNILFGCGPGSVMRLVSYSSEQMKGFVSHAHSLELQLLAETGLAGMGAFGFMVYSGLRKAFQYYRQNKNNEGSYVAIGFMAAIAALLVHGLVDCTVLIPTRSLVFLIYLSIFPAISYQSSRAEGVGLTSSLGC